ncbi:MAG TPA: FKBP-type peptidyl-prolyl cis-trans isomerase [Candidatus Norongarragalinales archaeon]|jgi:FKBP-type peptidyl-prolyl cis-trans isomerase SlyD|nr:FKBP-type peptidyl-prolyl cis-trans isomerase [Candidatus Norongarragalinales archaeon]
MIKQGDFVKLEFTGKDQNGNIFDSTNEETAKKAGIAREGQHYGPQLAIQGSGQLPNGLDHALLDAKIGEEKTINLTPDKAFGPRKEELVRVVPLQQFKNNGMEPQPGMVVEADGAFARVQSVNGGRVRLDFNHELAGQNITYTFKIDKIITDTNEKIQLLCHDMIDPRIQTTYNEGTATIKIGANDLKDANYFIAKTRFAERALRWIPEIKKIIVNEEYARPQNTK